MKVRITKMDDHLHVGTLHGETTIYYKKDIEGILANTKLSWDKMISYTPVTVELTKKTLMKYHDYVKGRIYRRR